jgi:hypothetical protein
MGTSEAPTVRSLASWYLGQASVCRDVHTTHVVQRRITSSVDFQHLGGRGSSSAMSLAGVSWILVMSVRGEEVEDG